MGVSTANKVIAALATDGDGEVSLQLEELSDAVSHGTSEEVFALFTEALSHPRALDALRGPDGAGIDSLGWPSCFDGIFETYRGDWNEVRDFAQSLGGLLGDGIAYAMVRHGKLDLRALSPLLKTCLAETYAKASPSDRDELVPPDSPLLENRAFANAVFEAIRDFNASIDPHRLERLFVQTDAELKVWGLASMRLEGLSLLDHATPPPVAFEQLLDLLLGHHNVGTWDHRLNYNSPQDTCAIVLGGYARCLAKDATIPQRFTPLVQRVMKSNQLQTQTLLLEIFEHLPSDTREELNQADS